MENKELVSQENFQKEREIEKQDVDKDDINIGPEIIFNKDINKKKNNYNSFVTVLIWIVIIVGFLAGVLYIYMGGEKSLDLINDWFDKVIQRKSDANILNLFLFNITPSVIFIIIIFSLGFSPIYSFLIGFCSFLKGIGLGLNVSYVYISYGWRGIIYESIIDIPFNIIIMSIFVLAARESMKFSDGIYSVMKNKINNNISVSRYFIKFIIILIMLIISSFLNSIFDFIFFKYLNIL